MSHRIASPLLSAFALLFLLGVSRSGLGAPGSPDKGSPDAWRDWLDEMAKACALAEARGVKLGIEPELANVVDGAEKARRLIDSLQSPALAIVLDPANLFEVAPLAQQRDILSHAVDLLADRIAMAHAKDRDRSGGFCAAFQVFSGPFAASAPTLLLSRRAVRSTTRNVDIAQLRGDRG